MSKRWTEPFAGYMEEFLDAVLRPNCTVQLGIITPKEGSRCMLTYQTRMRLKADDLDEEDFEDVDEEWEDELLEDDDEDWEDDFEDGEDWDEDEEEEEVPDADGTG
jgi:hypothetical protein